MPVSHGDVRRMAELARIALPAERLDDLARELNEILAHMDALAAISDAGEAPPREAGMRLAPDEGPSLPLGRSRDAMAPEFRDGFFLVPRLSTHESDDEI